MYTSTKRVTRDGRLVAYKGETMSDDEARERGLLKEEKPKGKAPRRKAKPEDAHEEPEDEEE